MRRGQRTGPRRSLPWPLTLFSSGQRPPLFPDTARFSFPWTGPLWNGGGGVPVVEAAADDLADGAPYDGTQSSASGPRFMATTASGKSLQVVVKTAAVAARQHPHGDGPELHPSINSNSRSWQELASSDGRQLAPGGSYGPPTAAAAASLPLTPSHSNGSGMSDSYDAAAPPYGLPGSAASHPNGNVSKQHQHYHSGGGPAVGRGPAGGSLGEDDEEEDEDGYDAFGGGSRGPYRQAYDHAYGADPARGTWHGGAHAASPVPGGGGGGAGGGVGSPGSNPFGGRAGELDPAAAWYSRALHRQAVSAAAAAAAQATSAALKAHQA